MSRASASVVTGLIAALTIVAAGCDDRAAVGDADAGPGAGERPLAPDEGIRRVTTKGPVEATVQVAPEAPRLGDPIRLVLTVVAAEGVQVRMPPFGDALGRFEIVDYAPRRRVLADGATWNRQSYTLQAPMSGRQTIPSLLVEFDDGRETDDGPGELRELLTDAIEVEVGSVLAGEDDALRPRRGPLPPLPTAAERRRPFILLGVVIAVAVGLAVGVAGMLMSAARRRRQRSAFDVALARLGALEARGLPGADDADGWYVELSGVVRRYLEDGLGLRAPELTTEEFIREAGRSELLAAAHASLLRGFLERCDRVKFAAYRPPEAESRDALAAARRFVEESRVGQEGAS